MNCMWRKSLSACAAAVAGLALVSASPAAMIASDSFDYPTGNTTGNNGGSGWSAGWLTVPSRTSGTIPAGSMDYSDGISQLQTAGNSAQTVAQRNYRLLATPQSGTEGNTLWVGFVAQADTQTGHAGLGLFSAGDITASANEKVLIGKSAATGADKWGLVTGANSFTSVTTDTKVFMLTRIVFGATDAVADLWLNPSLTVEPGAAAVGDAHLTIPNFDLAQVRLSSSTPTLHLDELRIGTQFGDVVTAVPEPASLGLLGLGAVGLLARRRK